MNDGFRGLVDTESVSCFLFLSGTLSEISNFHTEKNPLQE
jgi:hypothetical protein